MVPWVNLYFVTPCIPTHLSGHSGPSWVVIHVSFPPPCCFSQPHRAETVPCSPHCFLPLWPRDGDGPPRARAAEMRLKGNDAGGGDCRALLRCCWCLLLLQLLAAAAWAAQSGQGRSFLPWPPPWPLCASASSSIALQRVDARARWGGQGGQSSGGAKDPAPWLGRAGRGLEAVLSSMAPGPECRAWPVPVLWAGASHRQRANEQHFYHHSLAALQGPGWGEGFWIHDWYLPGHQPMPSSLWAAARDGGGWGRDGPGWSRAKWCHPDHGALGGHPHCPPLRPVLLIGWGWRGVLAVMIKEIREKQGVFPGIFCWTNSPDQGKISPKKNSLLVP